MTHPPSVPILHFIALAPSQKHPPKTIKLQPQTPHSHKTHREVLERPGLLNIAQSLLQALLLRRDLLHRLLGSLNCFPLERIHRLIPLRHIIVNSLEFPQDLFGILERALVFEDRSVFLNVDLGTGSFESGVLVQGGRVTGSECLEGVGRFLA